VTAAAEAFLHALNSSLTLEQVQSAVVDGVDGLIDARAFGIYYLDPESQTPLRVVTSGAPDAFLAAYEDIGRGIDPVLRRITSDQVAVDSHGVLDDRSWRRHPFYDVVAHGGFHYTMQAPIVVEGEFVGTLNFARAARDGAFRVGDLRMLDAVGRYVADAMARALRFEEVSRRSTFAERALDALAVAVVATSGDGTLLFANRAAILLLAGSGRAPRSLPHELDAVLQDERQRLRSGRRATTSVVALDPAVPPLRPRQRTTAGTSQTRCLTVRSVLAPDHEAMISFLYDRPLPLAHRIPMLSCREQEIVELVARGLTTGQIAAVASITQNTVKQHLKRIFGKLGVHSRTELIAVASRSERGE
jgi:DNA-binding CsgD family transcriptional regulator/GAF domain-containing protein